MLSGERTELVLHARCPICGTHVLSVSASGRVLVEELRPIPLDRRWGRSESYGLCDECGFLAHLTADLTLN